jgi:hypothetical protein
LRKGPAGHRIKRRPSPCRSFVPWDICEENVKCKGQNLKIRMQKLKAKNAG